MKHAEKLINRHGKYRERAYRANKSLDFCGMRQNRANQHAESLVVGLAKNVS
jgi:hypothetical protein